MKSIDVKSLIIGILGTALIFSLMGFMGSGDDYTSRIVACAPPPKNGYFTYSGYLEIKKYKGRDQHFCKLLMTTSRKG